MTGLAVTALISALWSAPFSPENTIPKRCAPCVASVAHRQTWRSLSATRLPGTSVVRTAGALVAAPLSLVLLVLGDAFCDYGVSYPVCVMFA